MDTKELKTFLTLCDMPNYQKAAAKLSYAPSTLNKHIQLLERELGSRLFVRAGRQLEITAEGLLFREHAERILKDYYQALESLSDTAALEGSIDIGGCEMTVANGLVDLFSSFSALHPDVRMRMRISANAQVPSMVREKETELGIYYSTEWNHLPGLQEKLLFREPVRLMVARDNPLAARKNVHYEDLAGMPFAFPHDDCPAATEILWQLQQRQIAPGQVNYLGVVPLVIEKLHRHPTLFAVQHSVTKRFSNLYGLETVDLREEDIWMWARVLYRENGAVKPACRALIRHAVQYAEKMAASDPEHFRLEAPTAESFDLQ